MKGIEKVLMDVSMALPCIVLRMAADLTDGNWLKFNEQDSNNF